jgi:hypothetical protein
VNFHDGARSAIVLKCAAAAGVTPHRAPYVTHIGYSQPKSHAEPVEFPVAAIDG